MGPRVYVYKMRHFDKLKDFIFIFGHFRHLPKKMEILSSKLGEGLYLLHIAVHLNSQPGIADSFHSHMLKNNNGRG